MIQNIKKIFIYSILSLIFIFIVARILYKNIKNIDSAASNFLYPILVFDYKLVSPIQNWFYDFLKLKEKDLLNFFIEENQNLKSKIIELESKIDFINQTKELVDFSKRYNIQNGILAQIILKNFDAHEHFFLIDVGSKKSVQPDMSVVYKNFLVGRVKEVYEHWSKIVLITDQSCKVASYCLNSGIKAIHVGQNDINITKLDFVNHLEPILENDLIISSGDGTVFPRGFGLGKIKKITPQDFNYLVEVEPLLDLNKLDFCYVIQKGAEINYLQSEEIIEIKKNEKPENVSITKINEQPTKPIENITGVSNTNIQHVETETPDVIQDTNQDIINNLP